MPIKKKYKNKSPQVRVAGFTLIEMVIVIVLASILGIFVFGVLTKCLLAQRDMQMRKKRSDDAILSMDRMNRELREAKRILYAGTNTLMFEKKASSMITDSNRFVRYVRDTSTNRLMRQSTVDETSLWALWGNSTAGSAIATNVTYFYCLDNSFEDVTLELTFEGGSSWQTNVFPRDYYL